MGMQMQYLFQPARHNRANCKTSIWEGKTPLSNSIIVIQTVYARINQSDHVLRTARFGFVFIFGVV